VDREERLQLLNAYADGELSPEEREVVENMLREDPDAAYESTQIVNIKKLIKTWEGTPGSGRLRDKVLAEVGGDKDEAGTGHGAIVVLTVVATVLIIAGAVFLYIWYAQKGASQQPEPGSSPTESAPEDPTGFAPDAPAGSEKASTGAAPGDAVLRITTVNGAASIEDEGRITPAAAGSWLAPKQTLLVDEAAQVDLSGDEGLRLRLARRGRLAVLNPQEVRLESGRVLLHLPTDFGPFAVITGKTRLEAGKKELQREVFALVEQHEDGRGRVALRSGWAQLAPMNPESEASAEVLHGGNEILLASDGSKLRQQFYQPGAEFDGFGPVVGAP
jgi:hypothetical protein